MEKKKVFENEKGCVYELMNGYYKIVYAIGIYCIIEMPLDSIINAYLADNNPMNVKLQ